MRVVWDDAKNLANQRKHGVSFEQAAELFASSSDYLEIFDEAHSESEDRFIAIGPIAQGLVLVVWTEMDDETLRIISARWADPREQALYHFYMDERR
ncbi:MAG TPA: BrnT family toxin [Thermoanaerobaculia bacterium]